MNFLKFFFTFLLISTLGSSFTHASSSSYDISTLYLKLHNGQSFKVTLNGTIYNQNQNTHTIEGVQPGKYMLKITLPTTSPTAFNASNKEQEQVVFEGYIVIPPRRVVFAYIDALGNFRVAKEKNTTTVSLPHTNQQAIANLAFIETQVGITQEVCA